MQTLNLIQGTPEWAAHRAKHFNASDAPAMLGCSPYKTRAQLLQEMHTGLAPEADVATQKRFDNGHRAEALARPLAEEIIGEDLYPVTGTLGRLSASFDGLTLLEDTDFEHKALSAELKKCFADMQTIAPEYRDASSGKCLPKHHRVQMEQQLHVSGAQRVLFMSSSWDGATLVEEHHCWYYPDEELRAEILRGWDQFAKDLAAYEPPAAATTAPVAAPVQALPSVVVQVQGAIAISDNFKVFEVALRDFLEHRLIRAPKTDQDFADLDVQIKAMKGAEAALESAEAQMLAQIQTVDQAKKTKDMLAKLVRDSRLMAEKLLAAEKERRRGEIVAGGIKAIQAHIDGLNARLGMRYMPTVLADFAGCIKGLKTLSSMEDKVATELARLKIGANEIADRIDANLKALRELASEHAFLFADTAGLVLKAPDDCRAVIVSRISEHRAAEERRLSAERERIRAEEEAKVRREQEQEQREAEARRLQEAQARQAAQASAPAQPLTPEPIAAPAVIQQAQNVVPIQRPTAPPSLRLGVLNERIAPLSIDAAGLASLGFPAAATDRSSKLYHEQDFPRICAALIAHLGNCQQRKAA